jgi:hypothetical protein
MKKDLLLTFDYELFLGKRSGSVDNCLIIPTNKLLEILKKKNKTAIFFVDTTYINRLEETAKKHELAKNDYHKIYNQLTEIAKNGHYLFHHLHPHWLDAVYLPDENQWDLSIDNKYTFLNLTKKEQEEIFKYSDNFLKSIYKDAVLNKEPNGFRAGGFYIEPFAIFKEFFNEYGIRYDFDVMRGFSKKGETHFFDFSNCPENNIYRFENKVIEENINGSFLEFTISSYDLKGIYKILNGINYRLFKNKYFPYGDGKPTGAKYGITSDYSFFKKYFMSKSSVNLELLNSVTCRKYISLLKKHNYLQFVSHPKLFSEKSLYYFEKFLQKADNRYEIETDFLKFI